MVSLSFRTSAVLLITALIIVQGAAALTIEQAPLNPAFVAYMEDGENGNMYQSSIDSCVDPVAVNVADAPYATGLLPSPALAFWPDGYVAEAATDGSALPARFDLRDEGRVTPVRDQGKAGVCWAFASYGSLESTYLTDSGEAMNFSENNMKNLCSDEYPDGFDRTPYGGGYAFTSNAYLVRGSGPVLEDDDPYALPYPSNISRTDLAPVLDVRDVTLLPARTGPLNNDLYKETLMDEGAIWVSFIVNWSCFADNYTTYYRPENGCAVDGGHAVTLVGWDDAFPKESFAVTPPGNGAFILKNSWGTKAGEDGFFYISYYDPRIGRLVNAGDEPYDYTYYNTPGALYTGVPAVEEKQIYQHDPLGWTTSIGTGLNTLMMGLNVFTADRYEEVTDVSFYTREPGTQYVAAVFTGSNPPAADAMPVAWTTGTADLPGYHTITLPDTVPLTPGEEFSVILVVSSPTDTYPLVVEKPIEGYSSGATAEPGESYVSIDLVNWADLTDITGFEETNVCIKAHTTPVTVVPRDYPTIMEAVNASAAGDTIIVESGTYPEKLTIDKPLTLLGMGTPVVTATENEIAILVQADNITLAGFSFEGGPGAIFGVSIQGNDTSLYDLDISGYLCGLLINRAERLSMSTTALHDNYINSYWPDISQNPKNSIDETVTMDGRPVIYREGVSGETIDASSDAGTVICVNCTDMTIRDTETENTGEGISLYFCRDITVENVTINTAMEGVIIKSSANIAVRDSAFGPDIWYGISAQEISGLQVEGNDMVCMDYGVGTLLYVADNATITDNTITSGPEGIGIWANEMTDSEVSGNTIPEGMGFGISITNGNNLTLNDNTIHTTDSGITAGGVQTLMIANNTLQCYDTGNGLVINAEGAEITGNTAENCSVQTLLTLSNSVVRDNHFSGVKYPVILVPNAQEDVFVYHNDFVLTEGHAETDTAILHTAAADEQSQGDRDWREASEQIRMPDGIMTDWSVNDAYGAIPAVSITRTAEEEIVMRSPAWHSPTEETYWYYGRAFTQTMGNYWSTYNGTDTSGDGIGEMAFVIREKDTDTSPLVMPSGRYTDHSMLPATDEDPSAIIADAGHLNAGDAATLRFTGSAVQTVTVTPKEESGRIILSLEQAGTGPDGLEGPVYQYLSAQLSGMTDENIKEATFSFRVATTWLNTEKLLPKDMALWRFHDNAWQELPTTLVREENGWIYYEAVSPGFSTFAIAAGDGQQEPATTDAAVPGDAGTDTTDIPVTTEPVNETAPEPPVTVAMPEKGDTKTPTGTTPQQSPVGLLAIISGVGLGAALLFRKHY